MKRMLALMLTAAMLSGTSACSGGTLPDRGESGDAVVQGELSHSCRAVPLTDDMNFNGIQFRRCGDKLLVIGWNEQQQMVGLYDSRTNSMVKTSLDIDMSVCGADLRDDRLTLMTVRYDETVKRYQYQLAVYDAQMQPVGTEDCTEDWESVYDWMRLEDGTELAVTDKGVIVKAPDAPAEQIDDTFRFGKFCCSPDGTIWLVSPQGSAPKRLDLVQKTAVPLELEGISGILRSGGSFYDGCGEYDLFCSDEQAIYGIRITSGEVEEVVNFAASAFSSPQSCMALADGQYVVSEFDTTTMGCSAWLLTPRTQAEEDSMHQVSVAAVQFYQYDESLIARYNRQAEDVRLVMKTYEDDQNYEKSVKAFHDDLCSGNVSDLFFLNSADYQMLSQKGLFEDLRPWMERDPEFHEEDYIMPFLESLSFRGRQERMGLFGVVTCYAAKSSLIGESSSLSASEILSLDLPEGMQYFSPEGSRSDIFAQICARSLGEFVDYEHFSCSFNSDAFISLLELVHTAPSARQVRDDYSLQENRALIDFCHITNAHDVCAVRNIVFGGEDVTLFGISDSEKNGGCFISVVTVAISSQSEEKETAWDFIKFCLREENQMQGTQGASYLPVNRKALQTMLAADTDLSVNHEYYRNMDGESIKVPTPTREEADQFLQYLESTAVSGFSDSHIDAIVKEECGIYFADDCTAEEAANAVQKRVEIYLSENQ